MEPRTTRNFIPGSRSRSSQRGQTMILVVLGLSLVFLAVLGFAVDFGNLWFHRQAAQTAADAVCTAAVMDMLANAQGSSNGGFTSGTDFDCGGGGNPLPNSAPCKYANLNGYTGAGVTGNADSNSVAVTFAGSLSGIPVCTSPPSPTITMCVPPASFLAKPIVQVSITDRIRTYFFGLVSPSKTIDVPAKSSCGVVLAISPIPIVVLDPTRSGSLSVNGNINISVIGGPSRSIQINSSSTTAVNVSGGSGTFDLTHAGPNQTGADFGVTGSNPKPSILALGTTGSYVSPDSRISDPFALVNAPAKPSFNGTKTSVAFGVDGCPDTTCDEYTPGYYASGILVKNATAIFQPGIYFLDNSFTADANSCMRPSTAKGDGSGGTIFYFNTANSLAVNSNSGNKCPSTAFSTLTGSGSYPFGVKCTATSSTPSNLSSSISGTVLLAPCTGPDASTGLCDPNCNINSGNGFGDQLGSLDPGGIQRGILFFQNRAVASNNAAWQGGGVFLLSGSMYFHQCVTSGSDTGTGCSTSAYTTRMTLGGNPGSGTYVLGDIIVDQLNLSGTPNITMDLNPNAAYWILKASLLR